MSSWRLVMLRTPNTNIERMRGWHLRIGYLSVSIDFLLKIIFVQIVNTHIISTRAPRR